MFSVFNIIVLSDRQALSFHMFWQFYSLHSSCQKGPPGSATQYDSLCNKVKKMPLNLWFITPIGRKVRSQRVTAFAIFVDFAADCHGFESFSKLSLLSNMVLPKSPCRGGLLSNMVCIQTVSIWLSVVQIAKYSLHLFIFWVDDRTSHCHRTLYKCTLGCTKLSKSFQNSIPS